MAKTEVKVGRYHQARWCEPFIMEKGTPGERGIMVPLPEQEVKTLIGNIENLIPAGMKRKKAPVLPELSQMQVLRHYLRLSQETIGTDINIDIGLGTCTMKYNPKVHEMIVRLPKVMELHPLQDEDTIQGMLKIMYDTGEFLKEISGMDKVSLQPSGGSQAIYSNVSVIRAYHEANGEGTQRNEIITTMLSHPGNPGCASTAGYKIINLYPGNDGLPDMEALKAAVSERTAALLITNP
ncbi:MAG TPA: glycine dehydrogenase subunit 2, partial [Clostridia bacterium]|nr:glycine dehydrogenase subunit 2 [Clostridia bacterium]